MSELLWFSFLCSALLHFWGLPLTNPTIYCGPVSQGNPLYFPLSEIHYFPGYSESHFFTQDSELNLWNWDTSGWKYLYGVIECVREHHLMNKKCGFIQTDTICQSLTKVFVSSPPKNFTFKEWFFNKLSSPALSLKKLHTEESHSRYC